MTPLDVQASIDWLEKQIALIDQLLADDTLMNGWGVKNRTAILANRKIMEDMLFKLDDKMGRFLEAYGNRMK